MPPISKSYWTANDQLHLYSLPTKPFVCLAERGDQLGPANESAVSKTSKGLSRDVTGFDINTKPCQPRRLAAFPFATQQHLSPLSQPLDDYHNQSSIQHSSKMQISRSGRGGAASLHGNTAIPDAFTSGDVWIDPVTAGENLQVADVNFAPCARTHWHTHSGGQLLTVLAGSGWVCDKGGKPVKISVGDVIWCPAGTTHWHGADDGSYMVHRAVSLGGVKWLEAINDEEYKNKTQA
jgi:quercetin dioxygenase-like cupin family protein